MFSHGELSPSFRIIFSPALSLRRTEPPSLPFPSQGRELEGSPWTERIPVQGHLPQHCVRTPSSSLLVSPSLSLSPSPTLARVASNERKGTHLTHGLTRSPSLLSSPHSSTGRNEWRPEGRTSLTKSSWLIDRFVFLFVELLVSLLPPSTIKLTLFLSSLSIRSFLGRLSRRQMWRTC